MDLWHGSLSEFVRQADAGALPGDMAGQFIKLHRYQPSDAELRSWQNSLSALATAFRPLGRLDVGIAVSSSGSLDSASVVRDTPRAGAGIALEYHLPLTGKRVDVMITGRNALRRASAVVLELSPLFTRGQEDALAEFIGSHAGGGDGVRLLDRLVGAHFRPSKRVLETLEAVLHSRKEWHLLDEQRLAFNAILDEVRRQQGRAGRAAILVRGAPGTGKTVVAVQLLAACLRLGWKAAHSTGGKAFTTALRSRFRGADSLFLWNMNLRTAPPQGLDLLLVDEAHRVRETSDVRWTRRADRGKRSQAEELIDAAKVTVFLLDENQFVRPDEVGSSALFRLEGKRKNARIKEFDLGVQFRCGGCTEYVTWVDWLLGFSVDQPEPWNDRYRVSLVDSATELERIIPESRAAGENARLVAGFCWKWSDPSKSGDLEPDVIIGDWRRPWNRKAANKQYKPAEHPYTKWAETEDGESQVGCIYSAQGFEFTRIGVIWGRDLVWRGDRWIAQPNESQDRPVKAPSADTLTLVRNAYRVLLTRGLQETRLLVLDEETRGHVEKSLEGTQS